MVRDTKGSYVKNDWSNLRRQEGEHPSTHIGEPQTTAQKPLASFKCLSYVPTVAPYPQWPHLPPFTPDSPLPLTTTPSPPCLPDKWQPKLIKCFQGRGIVGLHDRPKVITMEIHNYSCQRIYCPADINLIAPSNNDRQSLVCTLPHPITLSIPWSI